MLDDNFSTDGTAITINDSFPPIDGCQECESIHPFPPPAIPPRCNTVDHEDVTISRLFDGDCEEEEEEEYFDSFSDDSEEDYGDFDLDLDINYWRTVPAPKSSIDEIPTVEITPEFIESPDSCHTCPICKDEFEPGTEAKSLPCSHIYHGCCIVKWLSQNNSCPVCRAKLPVAAREKIPLSSDLVTSIEETTLLVFSGESEIFMISLVFNYYLPTDRDYGDFNSNYHIQIEGSTVHLYLVVEDDADSGDITNQQTLVSIHCTLLPFLEPN